MKKKLTYFPVVIFLTFICCFLWGSAFPCIKIGYQLFGIAASDNASQLLFAGIRFTLAGVLTVLIGSLSSGKFLKPSKPTWKYVMILALFQTIGQYIFFYIGLANTSGVKSSIIEAASTFFAILIACLICRFEKLILRKVLGCLLGFAGVVLINLAGSGGIDWNLTFMGEGFMLISTISGAIASVLIKAFGQNENPVTLSGWQFFFGGIVLTLTGFSMGGHLNPATPLAFLLLLYMAGISAGAYSIWGILLKHNPVSRITVFGFMNPVIGVILSALLLGEKNQAFSVVGLISLLLICVGIYIVNAKKREV